eukprot:CAMPEP_0184660826 /NCGR_PEP_ID=MMETSP0308-20130426/35431_1 /TAXON_ID=38269 /ORGANISM="Gloeochaete witrockiana, Strain SAG 46.84" /LENGTH=45 /DNA_ID= /DNA_START= /DNA_END= /DNA_ORIENTATION=
MSVDEMECEGDDIVLWQFSEVLQRKFGNDRPVASSFAVGSEIEVW